MPAKAGRSPISHRRFLTRRARIVFDCRTANDPVMMPPASSMQPQQSPEKSHPLLQSILNFRKAVDPLLRRIMFPERNPRFASESDSALNRMAHEDPSASPNRADAELELDTRDWLRDFWSRSLVAWLALVISIVSITIAIVTCSR
jgi:hypothetical protein